MKTNKQNAPRGSIPKVYFLEKMKVGEVATYPLDKRNSLKALACRKSKALGWKFVTRKLDDCVQVERTA